MTQIELAEALRTTQSAIARLEAPGANPTVATLDAALRATGHEPDIVLRPWHEQVDESQIGSHLALSPAERARGFQASYDNVRGMLAKAKHVDD